MIIIYMSGIVEYSNNNNNIDNLNQFLATNSKNLVNGERLFNQFTNSFYDSCEYKNNLNLATKPMRYYVNSLNNISGLLKNEQNLAFTPIGNAQVQNISNIYERAIPSKLTRGSSIYTLPYSTSPDLQKASNINTLDTDMDLILKTGLTLRNKNNDLSDITFPYFGDIHSSDIGVLYQNAGQYNDLKPEMQVVNPNIDGLNHSRNNISVGNGILALGGTNGFGISSRNAIRNISNGKYLNNKEYKNLYLSNN